MEKRRGAAPNRKPSDFLPPLEVWLHDPKRDGLLPTPVDERGLVDVEELIEVVRSTVKPDYDWKSPFNDIHHLYWPGSAYPDSLDSDPNPLEFRELAINKIDAPRLFHNRLHQTVEPQPVPSDEIMRHQIEAQRVALALFKTIRASKGLTRLVGISDDNLEERLVQNFDSFSTHLEMARALPKEFQLADLPDNDPTTYEDMMELGPYLGKLVTAICVSRRVTEPPAA